MFNGESEEVGITATLFQRKTGIHPPLKNEMRHRHFSNSYTRPAIDQHDTNHTPVEQPYFPAGRPVPPENVPYVNQMNHISRSGIHSNSHRNLEGRTNEYPSSNINMEIQPFTPAFTGPNVDQYSHSSITEARSAAPLPPVGQHGHHTNYSAPSMRDMEADLSNCPTGSGGSLKRKRSGASGSCERSSIYSAGSSSSSSSQIPLEKPPVDCHRGGPTIGGEDSSRNVRRRYRLDLEPSRTHFYQSTPHPPNYPAPAQHPSIDSNNGQWNCVPHYPPSSHRRISPSEMNQFHVGASSSDPVFTRHTQNLHGPHAPPVREGHVNHSRRVHSSYGNGSRYSHYAHGGTSTNNLRAPTENYSSRNSRQGGWRSSYRSGRPRVAVERLHSIVDVTESHNRLGHEAIMMVDRASFYGSSRNFSDQYRDLRLDIDNMTYEELLNLEERIGNVSTGLSEDSMSKCLNEKVYYILNHDHEEVSCPICLEEYKNGDKVGTMGKCGHDYHVDCIKKWLLMKKVCPICKTECSNQEPTVV